jgi:hypothetical protein
VWVCMSRSIRECIKCDEECWKETGHECKIKDFFELWRNVR